ncbi:MAG: hypothetical protein KatS3mg129_1588 [Leptospiraceae bacterium]|nr:MAG: hypothetical protein KatS3mg129_1588 [Leptospiraceae bacterium]
METLILKEQTPEYHNQNKGYKARNIDTTYYRFRKKYKTGLYILPEYYKILYELSEGKIRRIFKIFIL